MNTREIDQSCSLYSLDVVGTGLASSAGETLEKKTKSLQMYVKLGCWQSVSELWRDKINTI